VSDSGDRVFAYTYQSQWSGVAAISTTTRQVTRIRPFQQASTDSVFAGNFDGRYLAWTEEHSAGTFLDWTLNLWDAATGRSRTLGSAPAGATRGPVPWPMVSHGLVAWIAPALPEFAALHLYTAETGTDAKVITGRLGSPVFVWPLLIWSQADSDTAPLRLHAYDVNSGQLVPIPKPLEGVENPNTIMGGREGQLAWGSADFHSLWYWTPLMSEPAKVIQVADTETVQFLTVGHAWIAWRGVQAAFLADLRSHAVTRVTERNGDAFAGEDSLLTRYSVATTKTSGLADIVQVGTSATLPPLPSCGPGS
jgi:hypothetical protein